MATQTHPDRITMHDRMQVPRTRGAASGLLLVILGIWGALIPFIGPLFDYAFTPDNAWDFTWGRFWLEILPGAATALGGLWLLGASHRVSGWIGALLAAAGGAWFVIGQTISRLWNDAVPDAGVPAATSNVGRVFEEFGYFLGLGAVIVFLAAAALGRLSVVGAKDLRRRDEYVETDAPVATPVANPAATPVATPGATPVATATPAETTLPEHRRSTTT